MANGEASLLIRIKEIGGEALDKVKSAMGAIADKAAVVGTALVAFGVAAVNAFRESELATNQLNQAMVQQGIYTKELADNYDKLAKSVQQKTTFDDDQTKSAMALLQAQLGQVQITEELIFATANLAAAKQIDLKTAADLVGKSIGTETNALARQGIELDSTASKTEKMAMVVDQLNGKFGGQAQAAASGLGALTQLKNSLNDLLETAGERMAPFIVFFTRQLNAFTQALGQNSGAFSVLDSSLTVASKTFLFFKELIVGTVSRVSAELGVLAEGISLIFQGEFSKAKDAVASGYQAINDMMIQRRTEFDAEWDALDALKTEKEAQKSAMEEQLLSASLTRKEEIERGHADARFTAEQQRQAKIYNLELKSKDDLKKLDDLKLKDRAAFLGQVASLEGSQSKVLAAIGKAAALAQITINTGDAAMSGYRWGMAIGGPPVAATFAGLAVAAGAAQAARVAGVQLAEGGIVKATPGGIQATIGEGGKDEAVIPLENGQIPGSSGGNTFVFNGPVMGDEAQAMAFAIAVDRQLLKLRQSNQSLAFEEDIF